MVTERCHNGTIGKLEVKNFRNLAGIIPVPRIVDKIILRRAKDGVADGRLIANLTIEDDAAFPTPLLFCVILPVEIPAIDRWDGIACVQKRIALYVLFESFRVEIGVTAGDGVAV